MGGLILGAYLAITAVEQNYWPILITIIALFPIIASIAGDRLCAAPYLGSYVGGKFNFIPFGMAAADMGTLALILYFLVAYVALRQRPIKLGLFCFTLPITVIFFIVLYHDHSFGLRAFGGAQEGSRPGLLMLAACGAYLCGINTASPPESFLKRVPWYCFLLSALSAIPYILSTQYPSLTPYLYNLSDNVNVEAYVAANSFSQHADAIGRSGPQAAIGGTLLTCLLCYYPINTWWRPGRWHLVILSLVCFGLVLSGGYRNGAVSTGLSAVLCIWCYLSWRTLIIVPIIVGGLFAVNFSQQYHLVNLPLPAQRSLSFLPGDWDWDASVVDSASSSNYFREDIQNVYKKEYLYKSPWFGNGVSYDGAKFKELTFLSEHQETPDGYYQAEAFIISKQFHTGWLSLYDIVGLVGGAAFVFLNLSMIWVSGRLVFGRGVDRKSPLFPLKVWMFVSLTTGLFGFFTLFGDFMSAFPGLCFGAIILFHLYKLEWVSRPKPIIPILHHSFQFTGPGSSGPKTISSAPSIGSTTKF